ncbi:unnamed protein product [Prunus brigantina]
MHPRQELFKSQTLSHDWLNFNNIVFFAYLMFATRTQEPSLKFNKIFSCSIKHLCCLYYSMVLATEYVVGDDEGWNSGVDYYAWLDGKTFYVGDVLVFNYNAGDHNVIVVDADGYDKCSASPNWGSYDSGNDVITLSSPGDNYYICQWHCDYTDQKLKVTVLQS